MIQSDYTLYTASCTVNTFSTLNKNDSKENSRSLGYSFTSNFPVTEDLKTQLNLNTIGVGNRYDW